MMPLAACSTAETVSHEMSGGCHMMPLAACSTAETVSHEMSGGCHMMPASSTGIQTALPGSKLKTPDSYTYTMQRSLATG